MKKFKTLSENEIQVFLAQGDALTFHTTSPIAQISDPKGTLFVAMHWVHATTPTTGTVYIARMGDPLKFDLYSIYRETPKDDSRVFIRNIEKDKIGYHYAKELPEVIAEQAPEWVHQKVKEAKEATREK